MFRIPCDFCDSFLELDYMSTTDAYLKDMDYLIDENGELLEDSIQQYLIYRCLKCDKVHKLTYKDWERRFRLKIAKEVMTVRKKEMFAKLNLNAINADNGMEYCGQCDGFDEEGNCLVDIIKQCTIRK